jgi:hypothetical protein
LRELVALVDSPRSSTDSKSLSVGERKDWWDENACIDRDELGTSLDTPGSQKGLVIITFLVIFLVYIP